MKTTETGGQERGYDGGKKIKGRKRRLLVDTLGLLIAIVVTGANADDGTAAPRLLERVDENDLPQLTVIFGDNKYRNKSLEAWMKKGYPVTASRHEGIFSGQNSLGSGTEQRLARSLPSQQ